MKILSIEFENHPILGNLKLDFTDKNGNPVDTIILAGENGCGKTTILEELYNLWNTNGINDLRKQGQYATTIVCLDQSEIKKLQLPNEFYRNYFLSGLLRIKQDMSKIAWACYDVEYMDTKDNMWKKNNDIIQYIISVKNSIFSTVDINFHADAVTTITSQNLDTNHFPTKRSNVNLASNINQMLVDIDALDNNDLGVWVDEHPNQPVPMDISRRRIKRFTKAFSFMFTNLSFYKIDNRNNSKTILFKRGNSEIPITQLSSGEKQIIYRGAFFLKDIKLDLGKLVLIDEPEISLHPDWQKKILGYYQKLFTDESGKQLSQMFIATHSPFIIHNPNRHNDKVVVLQKDDNGDIVQSDKPEYYDCNSCKAVEDSFSVYEFNDDKQKTIFVEDFAHENIVKKLLAEHHSDIAVLKLGSCDKVLSASKGTKDNFDNFYFVIDGDCKTYTDTDAWHNNTLQLKKYCIENYLLTKGAITHLLTLKQKKISAEEFIKNVIDECKSGYSGFTVLKDSIDKYGLDWSAIDNVDASKIFEKIKNKLGYKNVIDIENICFDVLKNTNKLGTVFQEIIDFLGLQDVAE